MINTLITIAKEFEKESILWQVGASLMLHQYDLVEKPNDIDIIVAVEDIDKADDILRNLGKREKCGRKEPFTTQYFYEYCIDGFEIDVMAGFGIIHNEGEYIFHFNKESKLDIREIRDVKVPFGVMEDWYVFYQSIPGRDKKVEMVEEFLEKNGADLEYLKKHVYNSKLSKKSLDRTNEFIERNEA